MKTWTIYLGYQKHISVKKSMTSNTYQLRLCYLLMGILKSIRTETFAGTLVIKKVKSSGAILPKFSQTFLVCLALFHIMEATQMVHIHLVTR
uniref:Uncharacterized protein n=1 Tax=Arundo donax TaxID=35708 RepID=A0A0A9DTU9_ARUDO